MCDLKQLLCGWKLENILPHLIDEEIDVETLKIIKISHIKTLLSEFPLGRLIRFEHNLEQWRFTIGKPLKHQAYDERNDLAFTEQTDQYQFMDISNKNLSEETTQPCINSPINLNEILMENKPEGPELLEIYDKNQTFSNPERSHLIDLIVNHYLRRDIPLDLYESYDIENAILFLFPNEKLDYYRNDGKQESKIYAKYLKAKAVYSSNNETTQIIDNLTSHDLITRNVNYQNKADNVQLEVREPSEISFKMSEISFNDKSDNYPSTSQQPTEILLKTVYRNCKKFVKIFEPFLLKDFLSSACSIFNIRGKNNISVVVNNCEISSNEFKNVILQYYKLPTFKVELKEKAYLFRNLKVTTKPQFARLVQLMQKNPQITRGKPKFGMTKKHFKDLWEGFALELNSLGPPTRTSTEWQRVWIHYKASVKKKLANNKRNIQASGSGPSQEVPLNSLEDCVTQLLSLSDEVAPSGETFNLDNNAPMLSGSDSDSSAEVPSKAATRRSLNLPEQDRF